MTDQRLITQLKTDEALKEVATKFGSTIRPTLDWVTEAALMLGVRSRDVRGLKLIRNRLDRQDRLQKKGVNDITHRESHGMRRSVLKL
jgi:hypothetical protein